MDVEVLDGHTSPPRPRMCYLPKAPSTMRAMPRTMPMKPKHGGPTVPSPAACGSVRPRSDRYLAPRRFLARRSPARPSFASNDRASAEARSARAHDDQHRRPGPGTQPSFLAFLTLAQIEDRQEGFLRDLHRAHHLHALLAGLLFLQQLALAADVAAVALGENVLAKRRHTTLAR